MACFGQSCRIIRRPTERVLDMHGLARAAIVTKRADDLGHLLRFPPHRQKPVRPRRDKGGGLGGDRGSEQLHRLQGTAEKPRLLHGNSTVMGHDLASQ